MLENNFVASLLFKVTWTEISAEKYEEQVVMESGSTREEVMHKLKQYGMREEDELEFKPNGKVKWKFVGIRYLFPVQDIRKSTPFITRNIDESESKELIFEFDAFKAIAV